MSWIFAKRRGVLAGHDGHLSRRIWLRGLPCLDAGPHGGLFRSETCGGEYGILFSAWGVCGFVVPGYFESLLDRAREAGNLLGGYREVYLEMAVLAILVACLTPFLRPPRVRMN